MALNSGQAQLAIEYSPRDAPPVAERQGYLAKQTFELAVLREKPSIGDGTLPVAALFEAPWKVACRSAKMPPLRDVSAIGPLSGEGVDDGSDHRF